MTPTKPAYAEDLNYWQTSQTAPDGWVDKAKREIAAAGGTPLSEAYGQDADGRAAYMLVFQMNGDTYKIVWPVLKSRTGKIAAARRQAATMLYYDVKARCLSARVLGARAAFLTFLVLPDGRTAAQASAPDLLAAMPRLLTGGSTDD